MSYAFVLTGGGTGGHVFPALAVAEVLRERGHRLLFVGTRQGMEAKLVPQHGYDMEFVRSGAVNRVGLKQKFQTVAGMPLSVLGARSVLKRFGAQAVFSMGGYVAGPVMAAAILSGVPLIIMEPNAIPGVANRLVARRVYRALLGFESTRAWFPTAKSEITGLPVRPAFFDVRPKQNGTFTVLITGGSRGARSLNRAARESWPLLRASGTDIRIVHQTGPAEYEALASEFRGAGIDGDVVPFISNMAEAFSGADLVIGRAGAGSVNEIAAAGMASVLVPFPFAADDHQKKNAEMLVNAGAARMILDRDLTGERLFREVEELRRNPDQLTALRDRVRQFAKQGAAQRAAEVLEHAASGKKSTPPTKNRDFPH
ncbi:MAG: undecaprenyldiphospho-muramoylpentapeptide beta-N-acetylglucosaminyltransferase [Acidobacteriaceae bacterium]|nr:undecaprenyldiphospho-muramoylpentapeptide beta-N-acetylglucosaminyltransferase [Acidobacteriaceae bacterium]